MNQFLAAVGVTMLAAVMIVLAMWGYPQYRVYAMKLHGEAVLAEAESSRQVAVREALALKDSAEYKAEAEILRAKGVAEANRIIATGLGGPEGYLRYLAINAMQAQAENKNGMVVYIPTEAGIPITEAQRFNKPTNCRSSPACRHTGPTSR